MFCNSWHEITVHNVQHADYSSRTSPRPHTSNLLPPLFSAGSSTPGSGAKENCKCPASPPRGVPVDELLQRIQSLRQPSGSGAAPATAAGGDSERPAGYERIEAEAPAPADSGSGRRLADSDAPPPGADSDWEELLRRTDSGATFRVQVCVPARPATERPPPSLPRLALSDADRPARRRGPAVLTGSRARRRLWDGSV